MCDIPWSDICNRIQLPPISRIFLLVKSTDQERHLLVAHNGPYYVEMGYSKQFIQLFSRRLSKVTICRTAESRPQISENVFLYCIFASCCNVAMLRFFLWTNSLRKSFVYRWIVAWRMLHRLITTREFGCRLYFVYFVTLCLLYIYRTALNSEAMSIIQT